MVLAAGGLLAASRAWHGRILDALEVVERLIDAHPVWGAALFAGLAALSGILVLFSSVVLVPAGVQAWGELGCLVLLWSGWFVGGVVTYALGRGLGRPLVERVLSPETLARYEHHLPEGRPFRSSLLVLLALQSDVAGYVLGLAGYPAAAYLAALAVAELPYAVGTVFLGAAFVRGQTLVLLAIAALALAIWAWRRHRSSGRGDA